MVVRRGVGVEVNGLAELSISGDEVEIVKNPERAVDGVERDTGHALADCVIDGFGVGMIEPRSYFAKDRDTLMSEFDSGFVGFGYEVFYAAFDFTCFNFHNLHSAECLLAKNDRAARRRVKPMCVREPFVSSREKAAQCKSVSQRGSGSP